MSLKDDFNSKRVTSRWYFAECRFFCAKKCIVSTCFNFHWGQFLFFCFHFFSPKHIWTSNSTFSPAAAEVCPQLGAVVLLLLVLVHWCHQRCQESQRLQWPRALAFFSTNLTERIQCISPTIFDPPKNGHISPKSCSSNMLLITNWTKLAFSSLVWFGFDLTVSWTNGPARSGPWWTKTWDRRWWRSWKRPSSRHRELGEAKLRREIGQMMKDTSDIK